MQKRYQHESLLFHFHFKMQRLQSYFSMFSLSSEQFIYEYITRIHFYPEIYEMHTWCQSWHCDHLLGGGGCHRICHNTGCGHHKTFNNKQLSLARHYLELQDIERW